MKFDKDNYFKESQGTFKFVANINANKELKVWQRGKGDVLMGERALGKKVAEILGITDEKEMKKVKFNYCSPFDYYDNKITSIYFTYEDKLIRISNHWSSYVNGKNTELDEGCGNIRSCFWNIQFTGKDALKKKNRTFENSYHVGVISFSKLESYTKNI